MTSKAAEYWSYARECELWAKSAKDERDRINFFEMQKAWAELALQRRSGFKGAGQTIERAVDGADRYKQMERSPAFPRRKGKMALTLIGVFLAGTIAGAFFTSGSRQIAETALAEGKTALSILLDRPSTQHGNY